MRYAIGKHSRRCAASGRELLPGDEFVSALIDGPTGLQRVDFSIAAWSAPPTGTIGHWRGMVPTTDGVKPMLDAAGEEETMRAVFEQLQQAQEVRRQHLLYVLGLLLTRKKWLKLGGMETTDDGELLVLIDPRSKTEYRLRDPGLSETEFEQLEFELQTLLRHESQAG